MFFCYTYCLLKMMDSWRNIIWKIVNLELHNNEWERVKPRALPIQAFFWKCINGFLDTWEALNVIRTHFALLAFHFFWVSLSQLSLYLFVYNNWVQTSNQSVSLNKCAQLLNLLFPIFVRLRKELSLQFLLTSSGFSNILPLFPSVVSLSVSRKLREQRGFLISSESEYIWGDNIKVKDILWLKRPRKDGGDGRATTATCGSATTSTTTVACAFKRTHLGSGGATAAASILHQL